MLTAWIPSLIWVVPVLMIGLLILGGALWALRRQRNCPSCRTPMTTVARPGEDGGVPSYEVLVCDGCANAATLVHGHQSRYAYCPACLNRSLHTPCIRRPDGAVKVEERCDLCGFTAQRVFAGPDQSPPAAPNMGQVIPFPTHRVRRDHVQADEG